MSVDSRNEFTSPVDVLEVLRQRTTAWKVSELARLLNLGKRTLYTDIESGQLPALKIGDSIRLNPPDVLEWVQTYYLGVNKQGA